jgi:mRNA interferase RelE/StbE
LVWTIEYSESAKKQLRKLDKQSAQRILKFIDERVATQADPRATGKALTGTLGGLWRYRIGDFRVICELDDGHIRILVLSLAHRRDVYR